MDQPGHGVAARSRARTTRSPPIGTRWRIDPSATRRARQSRQRTAAGGDIDAAVAALETARALAPDCRRDPEQPRQPVQGAGPRRRRASPRTRPRGALRPNFRPAFSNLLALTKLSARHTPEEIFALHRAFAERFELDMAGGRTCRRRTRRTRNARLRIGYVSPDCHTALPAFIEPVLRSHDRAHFDGVRVFQQPAAAGNARAAGRARPRA